MKKDRDSWGVLGIVCLVLAVKLLLDELGVTAQFVTIVGELSILGLILGAILIYRIVSSLMKRRVERVVFPLTILFMIFEKNIAFLLGREDSNIINNWTLMGCAFLLWMGTCILFGKMRMASKDVSGKRTVKCTGSRTVYIDSSDFFRADLENSMGALTVNFENADQYTGGGELRILNNMGAAVINVPSQWQYATNIENNLGSVKLEHGKAEGYEAGKGPMLAVTGENNLGSIVVRFV